MSTDVVTFTGHCGNWEWLAWCAGREVDPLRASFLVVNAFAPTRAGDARTPLYVSTSNTEAVFLELDPVRVQLHDAVLIREATEPHGIVRRIELDDPGGKTGSHPATFNDLF